MDQLFGLQHRRNREEVLSHVKSDAKVVADNMNPEMFNLTNQVYSQLMALMVKDRNYMRNMKQVLAIMAANSALKKIRPVTYGSELAKMGYLMYIPVDIQTFGAQVVFDENGESRLFPCDGLEFIFPATVDGLGTTLYKVAFKAGDNWTEKIFPAQLNNVKGLACVYRVPKTLTMTLSGAFDNKVLTLSQTTFDIGETQVSGQVSTSQSRILDLFRNSPLYKSVEDYLDYLRILRSMYYLMSKREWNVAACAQEAGFSAIRSFNRKFQDAIGMSPHEFRKLLDLHPAPKEPIEEVSEY